MTKLHLTNLQSTDWLQNIDVKKYLFLYTEVPIILGGLLPAFQVHDSSFQITFCLLCEKNERKL